MSTTAELLIVVTSNLVCWLQIFADCQLYCTAQTCTFGLFNEKLYTMLLLWFVVVIGCSASLTDSLALFSGKLYFLLTAERNTFLTLFLSVFQCCVSKPYVWFCVFPLSGHDSYSSDSVYCVFRPKQMRECKFLKLVGLKYLFHSTFCYVRSFSATLCMLCLMWVRVCVCGLLKTQNTHQSVSSVEAGQPLKYSRMTH